MTSKRKLKKEINEICTVLLAECFAKLSLLKSIMTMNDDYTRRISHPEPGIEKKAYFKDLIGAFNKEVDEIIDHITSIN